MKLCPVPFFLLLAQLVCSQIQDKVDFLHADVFVRPVPMTRQIEGRVQYSFKVLKDVDSVFLDAKNMEFSEVLLDSNKVRFSNDGNNIVIRKRLKKGRNHLLNLHFKAYPKQTVYFPGWQVPDSLNGERQIEGPNSGYVRIQRALDNKLLYVINRQQGQIWTQGQGKYTSHWLPSFDDMSEKVEFDLSVQFDKGYEVFANGQLRNKEMNGEAAIWKFNMEKPMSSYLLAFAIGNFHKKSLLSESGIPIELYFEPKDSLKVEPTYRHTKELFSFLEKEIGIPYPWQNYKQIPVQDFLYAGMENTGATIFSNTFVVDSIAFTDKNFVNVNAHEMAHQWFGNLVTEESGEHHWLHEGFATYYAYLAEKQVFGEDYFYWRLLETAKSLDHFSGDGNGEALRNASAGSLTFYEKGAWALVMLRQRVGDDAFREGIRNYLTKFAFQNVTIEDFMWEMEMASGMNLSDFETQWLQESEFPFSKVKEYLRQKSASINQYYHIKQKIEAQPSSFEDILKTTWDSLNSVQLKRQLLLDYGGQLSSSFLGKLLKEEGVKARQAIAFSLEKVPSELQEDFETLLKDRSYKTQESALYRLWTDFPNNRTRYLEQTKHVVGLPNKNVRLLWLTLALISPDYDFELKREYFKELNGYTGPEHHFEVRLLAFQYLKNIDGFNDQTLKNLIKACSHHVWHFKKSSRKMLKDFLKSKRNLARVEALYPTLNSTEQEYLDKTLGR